MKLILGSLVLLALAAFAALVFAALARKGAAAAYKKKPLMHEAELKLYERLTEALPDHLIFAQVSMAAIVQPLGTGAVWQRARNFISQKYVDYVVCDQASNPIAVIEFDGRTHQRKSRKDADATKDAALNSAGIKVLRWTTKQLPKGQGIREAVIPAPPPPPLPLPQTPAVSIGAARRPD